MSTPSSEECTQEDLHAWDESKLTRFHWRMVITAGTGFFTDAYDLFIIGVVTAMLAPLWHLSSHEVSILNAASLASAALGAVVFGYLSDKLGRKRLYGTEVAILFFGALLSAFSTHFTFLLIARIFVGFGIGGDYPSSAIVASECAGRKHRGLLVLLVFAMQAVGLIVGPMLASLLLALHVPTQLAWRLLLGFGALPAAAIFLQRRRIKESPHYLLNAKKQAESKQLEAEQETAASKKAPSLLSRKWLTYLVGTAGAWFFMDIAFYGCGVSNTMIVHSINPNAALLKSILISGLIFLVFAVPGYYIAAVKVDKIGRKTLQYLGFTMMALCYTCLAVFPQVMHSTLLFILIYGLSYFFVEFGPNTTTFLIPAEIFPTSIRAKGHGISAAVAKVGAALGAFFLIPLLHSEGLSVTFGSLAVVCLAGIACTTLLPEMKQMSLEETEKDLPRSHFDEATAEGA
jgi:MFS transporter, PHS family, inorganic phosphate transporter